MEENLYIDFRVIFQSAQCIGNVFPLKDRIPAQTCYSFAHKFTRSSCGLLIVAKHRVTSLFNLGNI